MAVWQPPQDLYWLKAVGAGDAPMSEGWFDERPNETERIHFSKRPTAVRVSHPLLYYAAVHQKLFGIAEVLLKATRDPEREGRWIWVSPVRSLAMIRSFDRAPSLDILRDVEPDRDWRRLVQQMDYREITEDVFNYAASALVAAADPEQGDILDSAFAAEHGRRVGASDS